MKLLEELEKLSGGFCSKLAYTESNALCPLGTGEIEKSIRARNEVGLHSIVVDIDIKHTGGQVGKTCRRDVKKCLSFGKEAVVLTAKQVSDQAYLISIGNDIVRSQIGLTPSP